MSTTVTREQIEATVEDLPTQNRIMIRLLLIQYLDVVQADIEFMAADGNDPRFTQGQKSTRKVLSRDAIQAVADRVEQYRSQVRQKRERIWLQIECLRKQLVQCDALGRSAMELLMSRFGYDQQAIRELKEGARAAVPRPALRALQKKWDQDEISEEDYRKERLPHLCQDEFRRAQRFRIRLQVAEREFAGVSRVPLQDHEIAHIWCLPFSSLAARKVKAFHQYLQSLQAKAQAASPETTSRTAPPPDYWKETFSALADSPVQHSVDSYDGMEGSETALMDKLTAFASGTLPDELESRFWQTVSRDYSPNAVEGQGKRQSLFALQRLSAILSEMDQSLESLELELLAKISPTPKVLAGEGAEPPSPEAVPQLGDMAEHVLGSLRGEERS